MFLPRTQLIHSFGFGFVAIVGGSILATETLTTWLIVIGWPRALFSYSAQTQDRAHPSRLLCSAVPSSKLLNFLNCPGAFGQNPHFLFRTSFIFFFFFFFLFLCLPKIFKISRGRLHIIKNIYNYIYWQIIWLCNMRKFQSKYFRDILRSEQWKCTVFEILSSHSLTHVS